MVSIKAANAKSFKSWQKFKITKLDKLFEFSFKKNYGINHYRDSTFDKIEQENFKTNLTIQEQMDLVKSAKNGDIKACDQLVFFCYKLIYWMCKKINIPFDLMPDCIQEGVLGIYEAINGYDASKNVKFSYYVLFHIYKRIYKYISYNRYFVKVPTNIYAKLQKISTVIFENISFDDVKNIEKELEIENINDFGTYPKTLQMIIVMLRNIQLTEQLNPVIEDPLNDLCETAHINHCVEFLLKRCNKRQRFIISMRFGINCKKKYHSLRYIGKKLGITRERVRQILFSKLEKLKGLMESKKVPLK